MTTEVKKSSTAVSKTVLVYSNLGGLTTPTFTSKINLNFVPDELIVRQLAYRAFNAETDVYLLYSDLVSGYLGTFIDASSASPQTTFPLTNFSNNTYTFSVQTAPGVSAEDAAGILCVVLEFIKN